MRLFLKKAHKLALMTIPSFPKHECIIYGSNIHMKEYSSSACGLPFGCARSRGWKTHTKQNQHVFIILFTLLVCFRLYFARSRSRWLRDSAAGPNTYFVERRPSQTLCVWKFSQTRQAKSMLLHGKQWKHQTRVYILWFFLTPLVDLCHVHYEEIMNIHRKPLTNTSQFTTFASNLCSSGFFSGFWWHVQSQNLSRALLEPPRVLWSLQVSQRVSQISPGVSWSSVRRSVDFPWRFQPVQQTRDWLGTLDTRD